MKNKLIISAMTIQFALMAILSVRSADPIAIAAAAIALLCIIRMLLKGTKKSSWTLSHVDRPTAQGGSETGGQPHNDIEQPQDGSGEPVPVCDGGIMPPTKDAATTDGYFERYLVHIANKLDVDAANRVRTDVEAVLGADTNGRIDEIISRTESRCRAKGLVVGRVQAGKTQNYTGLIARAIDEGWNTVIVLTSSNTALEHQTIKRLRKDLTASGLTEDKYTLIDNYLADALPAMSGISEGKIFVGFALKQADHLRGRNGNGKGVIGWFRNNEPHLAKARVMLIDDEADNATQNTVPGASDWSDESVLRYAENVRQEGVATKEEETIRVAEWIMGLAAHEDVAAAQDEQKTNALKAMLEDRIGEEDVRLIVRKYSEYLRLDRKVPFRGRDADSPIAPHAGGFVENYFTRSGHERGHSRGDDFRAILRWFLDVRKARSVINGCIRTLVSADTFPCAKLAYVGYTATPYANFLNEELGADNPLELDFAQSMSIAPEYFGLMKIFGRDTESPTARMPIVRTISDAEQAEVTKPFMDGVEIGLDENLDYDYVLGSDKKRKQGSWKSLKDAIKWAIVAAAVRRENRIDQGIADAGDDTRSDRWTTMLVNLSRKIGNHNGLRDAVQDYLAYKMVHAATFREECLALFDERAADIDAAHFAQLFPDYPHAVQNPCRAAVERHLDHVLKHIRVIALNSDAENMEAYHDYTQDVSQDQKRDGDWLWIVIGGNRISRGLTFDGLVSSYFDRDGVSVNVDTLTQMGRWFGYRLGYELLPRVWMPTGAIASMKEICALEEDMHAQLHAAFDEGSAKPNPKMLAISRRLTRLNNAEQSEDGVENPMVVREFFPQSVSGIDGVSVVAEFLSACGPCTVANPADVGKVYTRLDKWIGVKVETVREFFASAGRIFSHPESERLTVALAAMESMGDTVDIVLSNPMNKKPVVSLAHGLETHVHGISECVPLEDKSVRFGKFAGQYDAWKAVVPKDIVESVEAVYGVKANTFEAIGEMFARKAARGTENHPVVQIGFIEVNGTPIPYVSVYCPGMKWLAPVRVSTGAVVDSFPPAAEEAQRSDSGAIATELARVLAGRDYCAVSALSGSMKRFLHAVEDGKAQMPQGYGLWRETRSGYGTGAAVFRTEWVKDAHEFLGKVIDEAACAVAAHVKGNPSTVFRAVDLWRTVTNGQYNGILEPTGKHVLPQRLGDREERMLAGYGVACAGNGSARPQIKAQ